MRTIGMVGNGASRLIRSADVPVAPKCANPKCGKWVPDSRNTNALFCSHKCAANTNGARRAAAKRLMKMAGPHR